MPEPLLHMDGVEYDYRAPEGGRRPVLVDVTLALTAGESLGLVGLSGAGKTTLALLALGLERPARGRVLWKGRDLAVLDDRGRREAKRSVQIVWQDPVRYLNPYLTLGQLIAEPLEALGSPGGRSIRARVEELMRMVRLEADLAGRRPHEVSGGQAQRAAIARALAPGPEILVCDEAFSALDLVNQAHLMTLLDELRRYLGLTTLFISHDLLTVRRLCDRIALLHDGRIVETGKTVQVLANPGHPVLRDLVMEM